MVQSDKYKPYEELTLEECAQKQCDDMNYNLIKNGYIDGAITDEQLAELVVSGKITQVQADEIIAIK